ncbi:hypothetical protein SESBI_44378 [Sesbania bispinosa]|nr:hypothetical protein SESBI_44378 [Sesbania bispinosa]
MSSSVEIVPSSPENSLDSPDIRPFQESSSGAEEARQLVGLSAAGVTTLKEIPLSRSTSDGYEASGGQDSDGKFVIKKNSVLGIYLVCSLF